VSLEVEMRQITKRFPGVIADDRVDLEVRPGEIHALMGENGAGKSILMSILAGLNQPDEGEIYIRGEKVEFTSPLDAIDTGIGMVFQAFKLFPSMTIAENVIFGEEPRRGLRVDTSAATTAVTEISRRYGLAVDPKARVDSVPVGVLQRVEIIKALYRRARVLVLDEPTAVLTPQETERLFEILRALREDGHTIIFITHKMREVMAISDRVTVLRDGQVAAKLITSESSAEEITHHMTGRNVDLTATTASHPPGETVLQVQQLTVPGEGDQPLVDAVDLSLREGEIVGVAGVAGNGQRELAEAIMGLRSISSGNVHLYGNDLTTAQTRTRREAGLAYIPEDRHGVGTATQADGAANLSMGHHRSAPLLQHSLLRRSRMVAHARRLIERFAIKISSPDTLVGTLSGGNLQKVVVARELDHQTPVLIAEQPTRGVDIGAVESIHGELTRYRDRGGAILLISAELSEIFSLSDWIVVMFEGRIVAQMEASEATEAELGLLMAGSNVRQAGA